MGTKRVILDLSRGMLEAVLVSGSRVVRAYAEPFDAETWDEAWSHGLRPLDGALATALGAIGAKKALVTVLYQSPDTAVEIYSYPTDARSAVGAAALALADAVSFPLAENPSALCLLGRDGPCEKRQSHVLGAADHAKSSESIVSWLERAGCRPLRIIPSDAVMLASLYKRVMEHPEPGLTFVLHLGEHSSAFAAGDGEALQFVRRVDLGLEMLVEAMMRPIAARGARDAEVTLDRGEARELLFRMGVPKPEDVYDESRALTGADLLPAMQPVLQRYIVEAKQSMRFGLSDANRSRASLLITGPGAAVPGLDRVFTSELERPTIVCAQGEGFIPGMPGAPGTVLRAALDGGAPAIDLLPSRVVERIAFSRIQSGLLVGSAAAAAILAMDAGLAISTLNRVDTEMAAIEPAARQARLIAASRAEAEAVALSVERTLAQIAEEMGARPHWRAFLLELSRSTPESVRLTEISADASQATAVCRLRGHALNPGGVETRDLITGYIESLTALPLVAGVEIGATQRIIMEGRDAQQFELAVSLVGSPYAAAGPGDAP